MDSRRLQKTRAKSDDWYIGRNVLGSSRRRLQHSLRTRTENTMGFIYRFVFPNGKMYVGKTRGCARNRQVLT